MAYSDEELDRVKRNLKEICGEHFEPLLNEMREQLKTYEDTMQKMRQKIDGYEDLLSKFKDCHSCHKVNSELKDAAIQTIELNEDTPSLSQKKPLEPKENLVEASPQRPSDSCSNLPASTSFPNSNGTPGNKIVSFNLNENLDQKPQQLLPEIPTYCLQPVASTSYSGPILNGISRHKKVAVDHPDEHEIIQIDSD